MGSIQSYPTITKSFIDVRISEDGKTAHHYQIDIGYFGNVPYQKETLLYSENIEKKEKSFENAMYLEDMIHVGTMCKLLEKM